MRPGCRAREVKAPRDLPQWAICLILLAEQLARLKAFCRDKMSAYIASSTARGEPGTEGPLSLNMRIAFGLRMFDSALRAINEVQVLGRPATRAAGRR